MRIGIVDADLISRKRHRFPNLACMKISGYNKELGHDVSLLLSYDEIENYDKVFVSKVFTDTPVPDGITELPNVEHGGTGFYFDKAPNLPDEIEHHMPDYHLYDDFVNKQIESGVRRLEFKYFLDYSIGFITRGCFRKCGFCVNQKYDRVFEASQLSEFYDPSRKKICLLDDNFFGYPHWKSVLEELHETRKPFTFKQGLDERLLTDEKCELLCKSKYDGYITFAFDNVKDYPVVEKKLNLLRKHSSRKVRFYVLCAYVSQDEKDIGDVFKRIELLMRYRCTPYIMRFEKYEDSPYRGMYITLARWCNQFSFFEKKSFREYAIFAGGAAERYMKEFEAKHPDIAARYFDMRWDDFN